MRRIFGFFIGIFVGWMVGGTIALLFAPSTGEDLRDEIRGRSTGFIDEVKGAAEQRRAQLEAQLDAMRTPHATTGAKVRQ
jgi:gas vesicle protein